jgi:hypothetical protein
MGGKMTMNECEPPCLCLAREAVRYEPVAYGWMGGTLWATYPECPAHPGEHFTSPVWAQRIGRLETNKTASGELTV